LLISKDNYLYDEGIGEKLLFAPALLILTGIISTIIQFWSTELFWGIKFWEAGIILSTLTIIATISIIVSRYKKRKAEIKEIRAKNAAEEQKRSEEAKKNAEYEEEKKEATRRLAEQRLKEIEDRKSLNTIALSFIYENNKDVGLDFVSSKGINIDDLCQNITVSNNKKQIVWNRYFNDALLMILYTAEKAFEDDNLNRLIEVMKSVRANVKGRKDKKIEYEGEALLFKKLQEIENAAKK